MSHAHPTDTSVGELGPILLQRKAGSADPKVFLGVGVVCLLAAAGLMAGGGPGANQVLSWRLAAGALSGLLGAVIAAASLRALWSQRGRRQFVHERGLREESPQGAIAIDFDEADELEYSVTDHYHNGVYAGTVDRFGLRMGGAPGKEIVYRRVRRKRDEPTPFPPMVEEISARLATRIAEALGRGESVRWTSKMTIHPDGLTLAPRPWSERRGAAVFRKEPPSRVGWDDIEAIDVDEGFCRIRLKGSAQPRLTVATGEPNFHPGYRAVRQLLLARAASRPMAPVRGLPYGEKITVEYPYSIEVRFGLERAGFLVSPKARKTAREIRLSLAVIPEICFALLAVMAYFDRKIDATGLQLRLVVLFAVGVAVYAAIAIWDRLAIRRKVYRQARLAQLRYESGQGPDPGYLYQTTLGPPGFSCRMPQGGFERTWSAVSRVLWDRGSIIICQAGNAVQPEAITAFLPALAFEDPARARDAFERIAEWHRAARNTDGPGDGK